MKRVPLPLFILLLCLTRAGQAQHYRSEQLTWMDAQGHKVRQKEAIMLKQLIQVDDTLWETNIYNVDGPRILSARSSDAIANDLEGNYYTYDPRGMMDTAGQYIHGKREGTWIAYAGLKRSAEIRYDKGNIVSIKDTTQLQHEHDSIAANYRKDSSARRTNAGRTFTKVEVESEIEGGAAAWLKYLSKNLHYPDDAARKKIQGQVLTAFVIDKDGSLSLASTWVYQSVSYSCDKEAIRVIMEGPAWRPAIQNGRQVKSYKKQPISFRLN